MKLDFLIACHISAHRSAEDARILIKRGVRKSKKLPWEIVTDGNPAYHEAIKESVNKPLIHVIGPLSGPVSNNMVERLNQTIQKRAKNATHFNSDEGVEIFAKAFEIFYNYIKQHRSLNYDTPAQKAGLTKNTDWLQLIIKAKSNKQRGSPKSKLH